MKALVAPRPCAVFLRGVVRSIVLFFFFSALSACGGGGGGGGGSTAPTMPGGTPDDMGTPGDDDGGDGTPPGNTGNPNPVVPDPVVPDPTVPDPPNPIPASGQQFRGENTLESKLLGVTLTGKVLLMDGSCNEANRRHCDGTTRVMTDIGVPVGDIVEGPELTGSSPADESTYWRTRLFTGAAYAALRSELKVVVMPIGGPFVRPGTADAVSANNVLFVASAGNTRTDRNSGLPIPEMRDVYSDSSTSWDPVDAVEWGVPEHSTLQETLDTLATGKAILATWGDVNSEGDIVPYASAVKCGDAAEWCYTVVLPEGSRRGIGVGTSFAAPRLGAAAYYLFQLWDQADEVVNTLKTCAIDVGDPGVDREFGVGVVNVDCPTVANREVRTARQSVRASLRSPLMDTQQLPSGQSPSTSGSVFGFTEDGKERGFYNSLVPRMYVSDRYRALGLSVPFASGEVSGVWGYGVSPLGVSSTLAPSGEEPFFEFGAEKDLVHFGDQGTAGTLSLVGTHGVSEDEIEASATRLGLRYERKVGASYLSFYAGALRAGAEIGIPGRLDAGRDRVSVSDDSAEFRLQYRLEF